MDARSALPCGTQLKFHGLSCTVGALMGRGSNAMVYHGWYTDLLNPQEKHHVLIKELFPYHQQGAIYRDASGAIARTPEADDTWEAHRLSFEHGNEAHLRLLGARPDLIGENLNTYAYNGTFYTVLGYNGGRSLYDELDGKASGTALKTHVRRTINLLAALDAIHACGYLHLDVSPDNTLLIGKGEAERVTLIDSNSVYSERELLGERLAYSSCKEGFSAPEMRMNRMELIGRPTDFYSVAAVFYYMLADRPLSPMDMMSRAAPNIADAPSLSDVPDTVVSMVKHILRRGLAMLPSERYQSAEQLRADLLELMDRIEGVGVTHAAIWEAGRRNLRALIIGNPSLSYLRDKERMYPLKIETDDSRVVPIDEWMGKAGGASSLLTGAAGMGKSTALLWMANRSSERYAPDRPAAFYLSLFGWHPEEGGYITNRILECLRFKADTTTFQDARHALLRWMGKPLKAKGGTRPALWILLDGLNEAAGDTAPLIQELLTLSRMEGVRLTLASRSVEKELAFPKSRLMPLALDEVEAALIENGLLMPEDDSMRELLRTPLMLSIFISAAAVMNRQLTIRTANELLASYLRALYEKEVRETPDDAPERWRVDAALNYVLPCVAHESKRLGRALSQTELLRVLERCYRVISTRRMYGAFPQWIGHSRDIRGNAGNAEEWYGSIISDILWKRAGLLTRSGDGNYRLFHQVMEDYLLEVEAQNAKRLGRGRRLRWVLAACVAVLSLAAATFAYIALQPKPYANLLANEMLTYMTSGYAQTGSLYASVRDTLDAAQSENVGSAFDDTLARAKSRLMELADASDWLTKLSAALTASGDVTPWSGKPLDVETGLALANWAYSRKDAYLTYLTVLEKVVEDRNPAYYPTYVELLGNVADCDADIAAAMYALVCAPELEAMQKDQSAVYQSLISVAASFPIDGTSPRAEQYTPEQWLTNRLAALQQAENKLYANGALYKYSD